MSTKNEPINKRYDFVILFDATNCNPNGDPDFGNQPRRDLETGIGIVTDVAIKRKIRDYIGQNYSLDLDDEKAKEEFWKDESKQFGIHIRDGAVSLGYAQREALARVGDPVAKESIDPQPKESATKSEKTDSKKKDKIDDKTNEAKDLMCKKFFDVRTFGAVLSAGKTDGKGPWNCGQVRGPVQLSFAQSVHPIAQASPELSITRCVQADDSEHGTFGSKSVVHYGLYKAHGYISPFFAERKTSRGNTGTGFDWEDLTKLFEAIEKIFWHSATSSKAGMALQKLIIFEHNSALGEAPAHKLFDKIKINKKSQDSPPRKFADYELGFEAPQPPEGGVDEEINKITNALQSDQTVITIAVNEGGKLGLNLHPEWKK